MNTSANTQNPARAMRLIHAAMFTGTLLIAVVFLVVRSRPDAAPPSQPPMVGVALSVVAVLVLAVAVALLRPRIPARGSEQSSDAYWSDATTNRQALVLWGVVEGAGLLGAVACFATGMMAPLSIVALAVVVGILYRPGRLEGN